MLREYIGKIRVALEGWCLEVECLESTDNSSVKRKETE